MISISNLRKTYNKRTVLNIPNLTIKKGEVFGLVGNNGAGKTTFLRAILDLISIDKGEIRSGEFIVSKSEDWKDYTLSYIDESFLIDFLTPEEYFYFIGNTYGYPRNEIKIKLSYYKDFFNGEILNVGKKYIRDLSKGNKQKVGIVSTFITEPQVLIFDEPFNSLDPRSQILLKRYLLIYNKKTAATIIISSHDLSNITEISNRIVVIEKGSIIRDMQNDDSTFHDLEEYFSMEKNPETI